MSLADELAFFDATAQADLVRSGEVHALELVEAAIARIEKLNPTLNAVITRMSDAARRPHSVRSRKGHSGACRFC